MMRAMSLSSDHAAWESMRKTGSHSNTSAHASHQGKLYRTKVSEPFSAGDITVVLLGLTGAGKTTALLSMANHLRGGTLEEPVLIANVRNAGGAVVHKAQPEAYQGFDDESGDQRKSQTKIPTLYLLGSYKDRNVWALDTPGFLDTAETQMDQQAGSATAGGVRDVGSVDRLQKRDLLGATLDAISDLPHINALALVFMPNVRLSLDTTSLLALFQQYVPDTFKDPKSNSSGCIGLCTRSLDVEGSVFDAMATEAKLRFKHKVAMHNYHLCTDSIKSSTMKIGYEIAGEALSSFFAALADMPPQPVDSFRTLAAYKSTIFDHMLRIKDVVMQQVEVEDMLEEIEVNYKDKEERKKYLSQTRSFWQRVETPGERHTICRVHGLEVGPDSTPLVCHENCSCAYEPETGTSHFAQHCKAFTESTGKVMTYWEMKAEMPGWDGSNYEGIVRKDAKEITWQYSRAVEECSKCKEKYGTKCTSEQHQHVDWQWRFISKPRAELEGKIGEHKAVLRELGKLAKTKEEISKAKFAGNKELQGLLQSVQEVCKSCWAANKSFSLYNEITPYFKTMIGRAVTNTRQRELNQRVVDTLREMLADYSIPDEAGADTHSTDQNGGATPGVGIMQGLAKGLTSRLGWGSARAS